MASLLEVDRLRAGYGATEIVHDLSIGVGEGEIVALLGANGAGKTTSLAALSGMIPRDATVATLGGKPLPSRPEAVAAAGLAHVPQGRRVFAGLTVRENLVATTLRESRSGSEAAVEHVLNLLPQLKSLQDRLAGVLSGGEQQLVAIGRAIAARPRAVMIDELSLGLAPKVVAGFDEVLGVLAADGMGVLIVEQYASLALRVSSRVFVMSQGSVVFSGVGEDLEESELLRATYLGSDAAIEGEIKKQRRRS